MIKNTRLYVRALILGACISSDAYAWGQNGHRVVGALAETVLTPRAKNCVTILLGGESLARASTWADELRSEPAFKHLSALHYTTVPDGKTVADEPAPPEGNVLTSLQAEEKILRDPAETSAKRKLALQLIAHFVGDLHQPLHVGNGFDRGGNSCEVRFFGEKNTNGKPTNLHWVWDDGMISRLELSFTEYADFLRASEWKDKKKSWSSGDYTKWIEETANLRESVYPKPKTISARGTHPYCKNMKDPKDKIPEDLVLPNLGYEYLHEMRPTLDRQLLKAGWRLGETLNRIFAAKACVKPSVKAGAEKPESKAPNFIYE